MVAIPAVSLIGVLAAAVVGLLIGGVWAAVPGANERYRKWVGMSEEVFNKRKRKARGIFFVWLLITAYILGVFIKLVVPSGATYLDGLELGFLAWLGIGLVTLTNWFYENRPVKARAAIWTFTAYLATYLGMGAILAVWG